MLQCQRYNQNDHAKEQVLYGTVIVRSGTAAEIIDSNRNQRKTDRHNDAAGNNRREKFTKRL